MPTFIYTNDIPFPDHNPSTDQPDMLINTNSVDGIIGVDHFTFEQDNFDGYHRVIHQPTGALTQNVTRSGVGAVYANLPANIANINQVFSGVYTPDTTGPVSDTQFFSETGSGIISQLTGFLATTTLLSDGWQWVGGVLLQWGFVSDASAGASQIVTFKDRIAGAIPFPTNCFFVGATLVSGGGVTVGDLTNSGITIVSSSVSNTGFTCVFKSSAGGTGRGFYWFAVGN